MKSRNMKNSILKNSKVLAASAATLSLLTTEVHAVDKSLVSPQVQTSNREVRVIHFGSQPSVRGSADYFSGTVRIDSPFQGTDAARVGGATVTFEPGARTAWHSHPLGQTLLVTAGVGQVQHWGGEVQEIKSGDIIWIPPHVKHWHGATASTAMTHIAIAEALDGKVVDWMEQVSDEQFANHQSSNH